MGRRRLPRRFPGWILGGAALFAAVVCLAAPDASAQAGGASTLRQQRETNNRTVLGAPHAQACGDAIARADSSDTAVHDCDEAIRAENLSRNTRIITFFNRGSLHMRRREGELALADFDAVIGIDDRNAEAHLSRGSALIMMQQPGPAVAAITEALGLGVREPYKAYYNRAAAREALGDTRGAFEDYSTALEIQPDWGPASAELARFARTRRDHLATVLNNPATPPPN